MPQMRKGKPIPLEEIQEQYAAKGKKGTGKQALEPYADGLDEDGGETAEEEASENEPALPMSSTTDPPVVTTITEVTTTSTTADDPVSVEEEVNAAPVNVEEEVNAEQDTEVENALPPRLTRNDPEHEMVPMVPGSLGQRMQGSGSFGMASAPPAQHVQLCNR